MRLLTTVNHLLPTEVKQCAAVDIQGMDRPAPVCS